MSSKSNHEQDLLLFLSKNQGYVTSKDLLEVLNVSQKTVYRLINKINNEYEDEDGPLIISERGRGYKLDYEKFINYQKSNFKYKEIQFSPNERRKRIMEELLLSSPKPINVYHLFSRYYVGDSVTFNDEQIMSEELKKYNLVLERKNRTLAILGEEANIRKAIKDIIEIFNMIDIDDLKRNQQLNFNQYDVLFILDQLRKIEEDLDITIPYPYNVNIFSHLYILLSRSRKVPTRLFTDKISNEEMENMKRDILYPVAKVIVQNIEKYLNSSLPDIEIYFLYQYLVSSRMQGSLAKTSTFSSEVIQVTKAYIEGMSTSLGIDIDSQSIFIDLANHIKPMLNRLEHKIRIKNSLLSQIKVTYEEVFLGVTNVSELVSKKFNLPAINDDENGFITLYFAKAIETGQHQRPIKTLIMCTTGIGTSELLKAKVSKKFPELEIVDVVASRNTQMLKEKYSDAELILSTVHIKEEVPIPYLLVSAMFTIDDQKRLQGKIEEIYHGD
ncbi:PRD domain-containing protein [uncultured Metabacillus sp.]|uniref:BglG family transcription antiterminator n=1 Tax=uncultured Metabacillus sp. TaxID=2860135 RepID=UPI00262C226B|nr:PRD domain-containing protein [uncultured Metabacillus sp.]